MRETERQKTDNWRFEQDREAVYSLLGENVVYCIGTFCQKEESFDQERTVPMPNLDFSSLTRYLKAFTVEKVLTSLLILLVCLLVIKVITRLADKLLKRVKRLDPRMNQYAMAALKVLLYILTALIVAQSLGIPTTSLVALFSVLSLAVSLAVQDVLGNVAGGLVILFSKPFQIGDYIEMDTVSGTVQAIDLTYTKLDTPDGQRVLMPNRTIAASKITNYTELGTRRIDLTITASYDDAISAVRQALLAAVAATPNILEDPAPMAVVTNYGDSAIEYHLRCWSGVDTYWDARNTLMEEVKNSFDQRGITMTYNHLNVHILEK